MTGDKLNAGCGKFADKGRTGNASAERDTVEHSAIGICGGLMNLRRKNIETGAGNLPFDLRPKIEQPIEPAIGLRCEDNARRRRFRSWDLTEEVFGNTVFDNLASVGRKPAGHPVGMISPKQHEGGSRFQQRPDIASPDLPPAFQWIVQPKDARLERKPTKSF